MHYCKWAAIHPQRKVIMNVKIMKFRKRGKVYLFFEKFLKNAAAMTSGQISKSQKLNQHFTQVQAELL